MSDQALGLRSAGEGWPETAAFLPQPEPRGSLRVIAVASGKGGVGKSNVVVNLALAFDRMGKRVLIMDADLGLANVDLLMGVTARWNISHVLSGHRTIEEVLVPGPGNIRLMPASSGVQSLSQLTDRQKLTLLDTLDELESDVDVLLLDTGAGISDTVLYFILAAHEKIIVITPEPTSLTDSYALIKVLHLRHGERRFGILANSVRDERAGKAVFAQISRVADHFLDGLSLDYLGAIPKDDAVLRAVMEQRPLLLSFPEAPASRAFLALGRRLENDPPPAGQGNIRFFWKRLLQA